MRWYTGDATYDTLLALGFAFAAIVFVVSWFLPAPYGRFASARFGFRVDPRLGWFLMELPATVSFLFFYARGPARAQTVPLVFLCIWLVHYANRGFFFPLSMRVRRGEQGSFGLLVVVSGWFVTTLHGYFHAAYFTREGGYSAAWLTDPRFILGAVTYATCLALNVQSDAILRRLRTPADLAANQSVYKIPQGGLFRWVSSPSYLTELGAWAGFAICTWSLAGVFIFLVSAANLVPRAAATQRWYRERFPEYPRERRALVPFVW